MSHDSYSPFTKIDGYGFGDNNPIMNTDPSGHMPKWTGYVMGTLEIGMAIVSAMLLPTIAVGVASIVGNMVVSETVTAIGTASGSLQIASYGIT